MKNPISTLKTRLASFLTKIFCLSFCCFKNFTKFQERCSESIISCLRKRIIFLILPIATSAYYKSLFVLVHLKFLLWNTHTQRLVLLKLKTSTDSFFSNLNQCYNYNAYKFPSKSLQKLLLPPKDSNSETKFSSRFFHYQI